MLPEFAEWLPEFVALRHDIHAHPELAFQEHRTSDLIAATLEKIGVDHIERGLAGTGIVATIHGKNGAANDPDRAITLRSEMDALPIHEETGLPYASTFPGKMHACGHDGHVATLLLAAKYLTTHRPFQGTVHLIFQPAEEDGGGANIMIQQGLFDKFPVKSIWGLHNYPNASFGSMLIKSGPMMAAVDDFDIRIIGKGGHAARPNVSNDPIVIAAQLVMAFQTIISRNIAATDEGVISVTCFNAGTANNVIPDAVALKGTIRTYAPPVQTLIHQRMEEICAGLAAAYQAQINLKINRGYPATINSAAETDIAAAAAGTFMPTEAIVRDFPPSMGAEDFAFYLQKIPGCFIGMGSQKTDDDPGLHNAKFDFNDAIIPVAATYWVKLVEANLPL